MYFPFSRARVCFISLSTVRRVRRVRPPAFLSRHHPSTPESDSHDAIDPLSPTNARLRPARARCRPCRGTSEPALTTSPVALP
ncbi:hypothetical protein PsYK624_173090 [Phanerochaete sordida]|uniref:Uncharacterized protein n=1 Tax=Phanerochaete sordida TaxID=48140 RepID=A0A9P3GTE8_9APHY|nr:hypothetical protein PsYK624_173090 [Phanerochaete sordida]